MTEGSAGFAGRKAESGEMKRRLLWGPGDLNRGETVTPRGFREPD